MVKNLSFINKNFKFDIIRNNGYKIKKKLLKCTLQKMKKVFVVASLNVCSSLLVNSSLIIVILNSDFSDVLTIVYNNGKLIIFFCVTHNKINTSIEIQLL